MLYAMATATCKPGQAVNAAQLAARRAAGPNRLAGSWTSEVGTLNQLIELWHIDEAPGVVGAGFANSLDPGDEGAWTETLLREETLLMRASIAPTPPPVAGNLYEMRTYRLRPGARDTWLRLFQSALPARETYSKIVALFSSVAGPADLVCHIWAYPDFATRNAIRAASAKDPVWAGFLSESRRLGLAVEQQNALLLPTTKSPLN